MENWLESLVSRMTDESTRASPMSRRLEVAVKELKRKSRAEMGESIVRKMRISRGGSIAVGFLDLVI